MGFIALHESRSGTQEPCLSRSPEWQELKERMTKDRGSITHSIQAACAESARGISTRVAHRYGRELARRFRSMFVFPVASPFGLRVSQHLDHATFPVPATSVGSKTGAPV